MTVANIPPEMMAARLELADGNDELAGRADAIAHVGWIVNGDPRAENLEEIQTGNLDPRNSSWRYINGYTHAWHELYQLLF